MASAAAAADARTCTATCASRAGGTPSIRSTWTRPRRTLPSACAATTASRRACARRTWSAASAWRRCCRSATRPTGALGCSRASTRSACGASARGARAAMLTWRPPCARARCAAPRRTLWCRALLGQRRPARRPPLCRATRTSLARSTAGTLGAGAGRARLGRAASTDTRMLTGPRSPKTRCCSAGTWTRRARCVWWGACGCQISSTPPAGAPCWREAAAVAQQPWRRRRRHGGSDAGVGAAAARQRRFCCWSCMLCHGWRGQRLNRAHTHMLRKVASPCSRQLVCAGCTRDSSCVPVAHATAVVAGVSAPC
eukprot:113481-Chlamydomonas_euryale.AAC.1